MNYLQSHHPEISIFNILIVFSTNILLREYMSICMCVRAYTHSPFVQQRVSWDGLNFEEAISKEEFSVGGSC